MPNEVSPTTDKFQSAKKVPSLDIFNRRETIIVSILVFSGTSNIENLLKDLPSKLISACENLEVDVSVVIRQNNPRLNMSSVQQLLNLYNNIYSPMSFHLLHDGANSGFGRGHNLNSELFESDYLLILNDDLDFPNLNWLRIAIDRMRSNKKIALIGDVNNPSAISPIFANGTFPSNESFHSLRYAEASILLVNGPIFRIVDGFDETITWAMGEDSDLSFKAQQMGYLVDWMEIPHQHFRSTSFNSLPPYEKYSILEHNRARLFAKWGDSFRSGKIGKYEVFDIFSDGLGDMFCALIHLRDLFERTPRESHDNIVINVGNEILARIILPSHARIYSEKDTSILKNKFLHDGITNFKTTRTINYALPFDIHSLIAGSLSLPLASKETISAVGESIKQSQKLDKDFGEYCVVHLEFERSGHHGRGPAENVQKTILSKLASTKMNVVLVGKSKLLDVTDINIRNFKVFDLQGRQSLTDLVATIANAKFFIGIDSFPFHVAQIAKVPTAAFFGSVNPVFRVLNENLVWPIVSDIDCIGCYHDQLEPGAPFCMKMNDQCTYDIASEKIDSAIQGMISGARFDWWLLRSKAQSKITRFIEFQKFHPSPEKRVYNIGATNQEISELIYDLTDRISKLNSRHIHSAFIPQLQTDNKRMRAELTESNYKLSSYERRAEILGIEESQLISLAAREIPWVTTECAISIEDEYFTCKTKSNDPQIEFGPFELASDRFGASIIVSSVPPSKMTLYWRTQEEEFSEERSLSLTTSEQSSSQTWWYGKMSKMPVFVRIDPSEEAATVVFKLRFFGDISIGTRSSENLNVKPKKPFKERLRKLASQRFFGSAP